MRPHEQIPIDLPRDYDPGPAWFYENIAKHLSKDFIRLMNAGLTIDQEAVNELRDVLDNVLQTVSNTLANNQIIQDFQKQQFPKKFAEYEKEVTASCRTIDYYLKEYDETNMIHRTYLMNYVVPEQLRQDKWPVKDVKKLAEYLNDDYIRSIADKTVGNDEYVKGAMYKLANDKMNVWNKARTDKVEAVKFEDLVPPFNPGSSKQMKELFEYLDIEPLAFSKDTGEASWGRDQVEEILAITEDLIQREFLQAFVDYSFSSIVRTNFIEGFDKFCIDDQLHGNFKNFGAKTYRPTSNSINLLNMPSTGSIYAKPLKKCIVAPPGYLIWTIDYSALEDRVMACLSGDDNKANIFLEGLDGHSLNACGYFPDRLKPILGENTDNVEYVKKFMAELEAGNKELKTIRQESKGPTFGLAYGAYPKKIADTIKCSLAQAEEIFNNYHNVLYAGITEYREKYVLPKTKENGYIHLGLGCRIYSADPDGDIRTLNNATVQFWSILTLLALNELHYHIDLREMGNNVIPNATIYDAIYGIVKDDAESIKWLNDTICPIMEKDFLKDQRVKNEANLQIGKNWADVDNYELEHGMALEEISQLLLSIG